VIDLAEHLDHEHVEIFREPTSGLTGVIAIHSTALGPAMGGLRLFPYPGIEAAVLDALRLSRAMTLKNAAAGLDLGGGKAVVLDDGAWADRAARMRTLGAVIDRLGGRYVTAEDVGTAPEDMDAIATETRWVVGRSAINGGRGDPSGATARTVFGAIVEAVALELSMRSLDGVHVGVLGVGNVGSRLAAQLRAAGATVTVADADARRANEVAAATGCATAAVDGFVHRAFEVLAPCAMGEVISGEDVPAMRCRIVAGAANNPLVGGAARDLAQAGILYVPDFLANCGGIIHVAAELSGATDEVVEGRIRASIARVGEILREARARLCPPIEIALARAAQRLGGSPAR
jgi:glutamate dehydrogenase/leucine dehydrogenase